MDGLALAPCFPGGRTPATVAAGRQLPSRPNKRLVVAAAAVAAQGSRGEDEEQGADKVRLEKLEQMELKLTMPKLNELIWIMARKKNPGVSMLDVEKHFKWERGKMVKIEELPFDVPRRLKKLSSSIDGLDLVRPVPRTGVKLEAKDKPIRPLQNINGPEKPVKAAASASKRSVPDELLRKPAKYLEDRPKKLFSRVMITPKLTLKISKDRRITATFSKITLLRKQKPCIVREKDKSAFDAGDMVGSRNEYLTTDKEHGLGIALLNKPEAVNNGTPNSVEGLPGLIAPYGSDAKERKKEVEEETKDYSMSGMQPDTLGTIVLIDRDALVGEQSDPALNDSVPTISVGTALQEKPRRLDPSAEKGSTSTKKSSVVVSSGSYDSAGDLKDISPLLAMEDRDVLVDEQSDPILSESATLVSLKTALREKPRRLNPSAIEDSTSTQQSSVVASSGCCDVVGDLKDISPSSATENVDWTRAENLVKAGGIEEVELISAIQRGYAVSFGSLVGFLPYRNLMGRWKFLEFESWLRQKGLDSSRYREIPVIGSYDTLDKNPLSSFTGGKGKKWQNPVEVTADMKLRDLQSIYDQEKHSFLSSSVGQIIRVNVVVADRKLKKLIVSMKPRENDEVLEKKRNLMARESNNLLETRRLGTERTITIHLITFSGFAKLKIGDVVKCCIKKITYNGIFAEIDDVTALVHQTDISWDSTLDAVSYYKIGQIVDAKVVQLDFQLERVYLSLKEAMPDPLSKTLDHLGVDRDLLDGRVEAAEGVAEWPEVDSLIEELQQIARVQTVSKGRFSLSPALALSFQVYMASIYDNRYKVLARAGNKVQEVIVQASLSKEEMASTILSCATRLK